jgi:peptidoglycan-associated lipoprotein
VTTRILTLLFAGLLVAGCASTDMADVEGRDGSQGASGTGSAAAGADGKTPGQATTAAGADAAASGAKSGVETQPLAGGGASGQPVDAKPLEGGGKIDPADPRKRADNILSKRSVLFEYDSDAVKDEYKPMLEAHAAYLATRREAKVILQGNADERGSPEYNLALGQRRAEAVKQVMSLLGVQEAQLEAVSLGEEKPRALGSTEEAWRENRRTDILYTDE